MFVLRSVCFVVFWIWIIQRQINSDSFVRLWRKKIGWFVASILRYDDYHTRPLLYWNFLARLEQRKMPANDAIQSGIFLSNQKKEGKIHLLHSICFFFQLYSLYYFLFCCKSPNFIFPRPGDVLRSRSRYHCCQRRRRLALLIFAFLKDCRNKRFFLLVYRVVWSSLPARLNPSCHRCTSLVSILLKCVDAICTPWCWVHLV